MSVLSDQWIRHQCIPPSYQVLRFGERYSYLPAYTADWPAYVRHQAVDRHPDPKRHWQICPLPTDHTFQPMIDPFVDHQIKINDQGEKLISYGLSSYGYDVRLAPEFKIFTNVRQVLIDPKDFPKASYVEAQGDTCIIPPNGFVLGRTLEYFRIPRHVLASCYGKSTLARAGIAVTVTPIEPGFEGHVVLEIANLTSLPVKLYANEGIAQFTFHAGEQDCQVSYADRGGKYQGQVGITEARL